jgi:homoserine dehydrogenase
MKEIKVGLIGFGTIGTGVVKILNENGDILEEKLGGKIVLKKIADIDLEKDRGIDIDRSILTDNPEEIIDDPQISIVIELIGGYEPAKSFILKAIRNGKHVITANKALLAVHGKEIFDAASLYGVDIGFEGSVGGGIPIIRAMKEGLCANNIKSIFGIINGTANYILSDMTAEGKNFKEVLEIAKAKGYAEADPTLDVEGIDTAHKIAILASIAFGVEINIDDVYVEGISKITPIDIEFAKEFGYKIKLLAIAKDNGNEIEIRVHPTMLPKDNPLFSVDGVFNAILVTGDAVGPTLFYGKGAGMMPTGSSIVSDIIELARNIMKGVKQRVPPLSYQKIKKSKIKSMDDIINNYYLRFIVVDKPGVLAKISAILGDNNISIASMIQRGREIKEGVPIVLMTHEAKERDVKIALKEIDELSVVLDKSNLIRIENNI